MHTTLFRAYLASFLSLFLCSFPKLVLALPLTQPVLGQPGETQLSQSSQAKQAATPPNPGLPGRRQPASPRGPCLSADKPLTALMPTTNLGLTISADPTFFFYVPQTTAQQGEFVLVDEENYNKVYEKSLNITGKSGIISINLSSSETLPSLKIGKKYHWYFSLICDPNDRAGDIYVDGWIQRVEPNPTLLGELKKAAPQDQAAVYSLYKKYGLWQETLTTLAERRRSRPDDSVASAEWSTLLRSVGLGEITQETLLQP